MPSNAASARPPHSPTSQPPRALRPLATLRERLTGWYLATLFAILLLLGGGLFVAIRRQISQQLDRSLALATQDLVRAAHIREMETQHVRGPVVDAIDELHIPERSLFVLDTAGRPIKPDTAPEFVRRLARETALGRAGTAVREQETGAERTLRMHAEAFRLASGVPLVAVAMADDVELQDRYAALIAAFGAAALAALLLVAVGGSFLVREATRPIERSVEHMRRFMADAAHELRTPLAVIRSRAEVASQRPRSEGEYRDALSSIERETERLGGIVENLLLLSRADTGELPVKRERIYLDDVALDATRDAHPLAERKHVTLRVGDFDEAPIEADPALIRQLIMILLDNSVKFTPTGGYVTVRVFNRAGHAILEVRDTGTGISAEHLPHVFERFFRGDPARTRSEGAGLGLSIARWIAEQHGAHIDIVSQEGRGSTVTVGFIAPAATNQA